jgi:hypothetical protein
MTNIISCVCSMLNTKEWQILSLCLFYVKYKRMTNIISCVCSMLNTKEWQILSLVSVNRHRDNICHSFVFSIEQTQ